MSGPFKMRSAPIKGRLSDFFKGVGKRLKAGRKDIGAELQKKYKSTKQTTDRTGKKIGYGGGKDKKGYLLPLEKWRLEQTQEKRSRRINKT
jgi:hypothetical protein